MAGNLVNAMGLVGHGLALSKIYPVHYHDLTIFKTTHRCFFTELAALANIDWPFYHFAMTTDSPIVPKISMMELLMTVFLRLVAVSCLYFGLQYWTMLVGYTGQGSGRYDLLNLPWKAAATTLAILYPVAAVGLWLRSSWGPVVWVLIAATEISMHEIWTTIFGQNRLMSVMIASIILFYIIMRINILVERRHLRAKNMSSNLNLVRLPSP